MPFRVSIDREICTGVANCTAIAPDVFELDDENKAVVVDPYGADDETIRRAAEECSQQAIILEDAVTGERIFP